MLIEQDPKSEEVIRPILRGRDIRKYRFEFDNKYLIALFPSKQYEIDNFPSIKQFLSGFYPKLRQTGELLTPIEIKEIVNHANKFGINVKEADLITSRKRTTNKWFETQDSIGYWDDFSKQKIVWGNLNLRASYAIAPEGYFVNAPCPMIVPANKYLLAILNSKLADYYIRNLGVTRNGGYFEYKPMFIEKLPVPMVSDEIQKEFEQLVDKLKEGNSEMKINKLVYSLYNLNEMEINFIESQ